MDIYKRIAEIKEADKSAAICIITKTKGLTPRSAGTKMLVFPDGSFEGTIGGGEFENRVIQKALLTLKTGKPNLIKYTLSDPSQGDPGVCGGQMEVYVEPITKKQTIIIIGAGHVGLALVELASWLNYQVILADDRDGFASPYKSPLADHCITGSLPEILDQIDFHSFSYTVLTTRSMGLDIELLPYLLKSETDYIGVIGSKRRWLQTKKKLSEIGISPELLENVHSPMGLEINAETPQEIALSIMSEIIMLREGGTGKTMKA